MDRKTIVIVEDDFLIIEYLQDLCESFGCDVVATAHNAETARKVIFDNDPEYILMDVRLGGRRDGVDIAKKIYERGMRAKIIFVTGSNEPPTIERIKTDHPHRILIKPINPGDLEEALFS